MKFFQSIRRQLLAKQAISRYIMYAIGEIILVVVGILIALAANNYNEQKKAEKQSSLILQDMLEDLASDTTYLNNMLPVLEQKLKHESWLLNKKDIDPKEIDSIELAVNQVNWSFHMNDRAFLNIQGSDAPKLAGYEALYGDISKYYTNTKVRITSNNQLELEKRTPRVHLNK